MSPESQCVIRAGRVLPRPGQGSPLRDIDIFLSGTGIRELGAADGGRDFDLGGAGTLALPALVNAHDHGRGVRPVGHGAPDDMLEVWLLGLALHPPVDTYAMAALAFARTVEGGSGTVIHNHNPLDPERIQDDAEAVARAARDVGIRCAFVIPVMDRNALVYGGPEAIRPAYSAEDWETISSWNPPFRTADSQLADVAAVAEACETETFKVHLGPIGPQWCKDATLERIAEMSAESGRHVQMHLFETEIQRRWADAQYPDGLVRHLDRIGLLSPRLTVAHGVWLEPDECALLAERGVIVAVNTSSNLRLRSGIAPVVEFLKQDVRIAVGLDGMSFDDDEDSLRELRLLYQLHRGTGLADGISPAQLFAAATNHGHAAFDGSDDEGTLAPGRYADLMLLDYERMASDVIGDMCDETDLLLTRMRAEYIDTVIVAGRAVVRSGTAVGVDSDALARELMEQAQPAGDEFARFRPLLERHRQAVRAYYRAGEHLQRNQA